MEKKDIRNFRTPFIKDALNGRIIEPKIIEKPEKKISYSDSTQDPRWQKMRLNIFNRDNWRCRCCNATNIPLNAHHLYYQKGLRIWEYDDDAIVTVCKDCHEILHK